MKIAIFFLATTMLAQTRIASDFEMRQMEQQVAHSSDFLSQLSGHLNLGDLRMTRNETALARAEYSKALEIAMNERLAARRASAMTRYSTATSYAALAAAKLGDAASAFALSEEAIRYASDSAKSWNLYATAMSAVHLPAKAASASRNAVMIAAHENDPLDLAIDQYTLASSLIELNQNDEAEMLLFDVVSSLRSDRFASLRRGVEKSESFEIYSSARGEQAAYISLLNRAQLRLARLDEDRGDFAKAREQYGNVLAARTDDPTALAAMARLASTTEERERYYAQAFDANPFSPALIRDYQKSLSVAAGPSAGRVPAGEPAPTQSTGEQVRLALQEMQRGQLIAARKTIDNLLQQFPNNDTLQVLEREIDERRARGPLAIVASSSPAELDKKIFTGQAIFSGGPPFETGTIDGTPFRFSEPTTFNGTFAAGVPLRLTYRILGATQINGADGLLIEPLRLEHAQ